MKYIIQHGPKSGVSVNDYKFVVSMKLYLMISLLTLLKFFLLSVFIVVIGIILVNLENSIGVAWNVVVIAEQLSHRSHSCLGYSVYIAYN